MEGASNSTRSASLSFGEDGLTASADYGTGLGVSDDGVLGEVRYVDSFRMSGNTIMTVPSDEGPTLIFERTDTPAADLAAAFG